MRFARPFAGLVVLASGCDGLLGLSDPVPFDAGLDAYRPPSRDAAGDVHDAHFVDARRDAIAPTGDGAKDVAPEARVRDASHDTAHDAGVDSMGQSSHCAVGNGAPPSCLSSGPGLTTCGAQGNDCCCATLAVPGGTYYRNYPNTASSNPAANPATVSSFQLDKYEVTVGRFRQYLSYVTSFGGGAPLDGSGKHAYLNGGNGLVNVGATLPDGGADGGPPSYETGWDGTDWNSNIPFGTTSVPMWNQMLTTACTGGAHATWTSSDGPNENLPINCLGWYAAYAFCIWDGGFLPSEAEWEYAAAGGSDQRNYPWGPTSPGTQNQYAIYGCYYPSGLGTCDDAGTTNIAPVGSAPLGAGLWGQLDLGGNVAEYALDSYVASYVAPCVDCVNEAPAQFRLIRGAGFTDTAAVLVPPFRSYGFSDAFYEGGVRCARAGP